MFDQAWEDTLMGMEKELEKDLFQSLYHQQLEKKTHGKKTLALYDPEIWRPARETKGKATSGTEHKVRRLDDSLLWGQTTCARGQARQEKAIDFLASSTREDSECLKDTDCD